MTAASDAMGERIRPLLARRPGIVERRMFGGIGFMLNGNMLVATTARGDMLVRVDPADMAEALARPGASAMTMGERTMSGFVAVRADALAGADAIERWIAYAASYVARMPPK